MTDERIQPDARRVSRHQPWVWGLIAALVTVAVGIWFGAADHLHAPPGSTTLPWWLLAVGFAASDVMVIRFEFREEAHSLTLGDIPLLVGLVFAQPDRLDASQSCWVSSWPGRSSGARRRRRRSSTSWCRRSPLSSPSSPTTASLAPPIPHSLRGWLAILAATTTVHLLSGACVLVVIALSVGRPQRGTFTPLLITTAVVTAINAALGIVAILVISSNPLGLLLFIGIGVVFGIGYREHTTLRRRHSELDQLYHFSRALAELVEADDVVAKVLTEAKDLLRCEVVELTMPIPRGVLRQSLGSDGQVTQTLESGPDTLQTLVDRLNHGIRVLAGRPPRRPVPDRGRPRLSRRHGRAGARGGRVRWGAPRRQPGRGQDHV